MSKKNNQGTRRNMHAARLEKEKEVAEKRKVKLDKKKERIADAAVKGVAAPKRLKRKATKGVRIKKHVVVRGIKVTDAESKKKIKEVLAAEEAMKSMLMDMDGGPAAAEEQAAKQRQKPSKSKVGISGGARVKASGIKVKAAAGGKGDKGGKAAKAAKKPAAMALD